MSVSNKCWGILTIVFVSMIVLSFVSNDFTKNVLGVDIDGMAYNRVYKEASIIAEESDKAGKMYLAGEVTFSEWGDMLYFLYNKSKDVQGKLDRMRGDINVIQYHEVRKMLVTHDEN